jgi:hypothetical protein
MPEKFSASQAAKFLQCHAAANLPVAIPNWEPPIEDPTADNAANRGTKLHEVFAEVMSMTPSDIEKMAEAIDYVLLLRKKRRFKTLVEVTEQADWLASAPHTTADLVLYVQDEIHVIDLKTGRIPVSAYGNDQLRFYGATYLKYAPKAKEIHLHIMQPWAGVMEKETITIDELEAWMNDAAVHDLEILDGDVEFQPGDHCLFCPANPHGRGARGKPSCPAMMQILYPEVVVDDDSVFAEAKLARGGEE